MNLKYNPLVRKMSISEIEMFQEMFQNTSLMVSEADVDRMFEQHIEDCDHELVVETMQSLKEKIQALDILDLNILINQIPFDLKVFA